MTHVHMNHVASVYEFCYTEPISLVSRTKKSDAGEVIDKVKNSLVTLLEALCARTYVITEL